MQTLHMRIQTVAAVHSAAMQFCAVHWRGSSHDIERATDLRQNALGRYVRTVQVHREIRRYAAMAAHAPTRYRAVEIDHIRGVGARFSGYRVTELALVVGGAAAASYGFASGHQGWQGVGVGVASLSLPLAIIDTLNDRRAHRYLQSLERATQTVTVAPIASPGSGRAAGAALGVGGRF